METEAKHNSRMNDIFPAKLKDLRKGRGLTQKAAAASLGIGQTTIANYENGSRLPDLEKLGEIADFYGVSVDHLMGREDKPVTGLDAAARPEGQKSSYSFADYFKGLLEGDKKTVKSIMLALLQSGVPSETIYRDFLEAGLKKTGSLWELGEMSIWKEHFISEMTLDNMAMVKNREFFHRGDGRPVLTLVPGAEAHTIGLRMISDRLEANGHNVIFLGNNIPYDNVLSAIKGKKPYAVLLSVTMPLHVDTVKLLIEKIKQTFGIKAPAIFIGGAAFETMKNPEVLTGADKYCRTYDDIERSLKRI